MGDLRRHVANTGSAAPSFLDLRVDAGKTYDYRIKAFSPNGMSGGSNIVRVETPEVFSIENAVNSPTLVSDVNQSPIKTD